MVVLFACDVVGRLAGYWVASEFGSYKYVAATQVRVTDLPYPPGVRYFQPPKISDFLRYLGHPQVLVRLRDRFGIVPTPDSQPLFEDEFDRKTEVLTLTVDARDGGGGGGRGQ